MADLFILRDAALHLTQSQLSLSGNITAASIPVKRVVLIYKNGEKLLYANSVSDASGNWSVEVFANAGDKFRVVIVGSNGEYSKVYENVVAG